MGARTVKNYPSPRLMETIGATNQKPAEAIGELVANSFDARVPGTKLNITIDLRGGKIIVLDNGKGMDSYALEHAVCIGEDMSRYIDRGEGAKGHFGMGFKTSCSTLGRFYEIYTRPLDGDTEYHVAFDISEYGNRPSGSDAWDVTIEDKPVDGTGPLGDAECGSAFVISKLKNKSITVSAVLEYLGEAFKGHLVSGDTITVIDDITGANRARPKEHRFKQGTKIDIDTAFGPNNEYKITGWAAIDTQTHNNGLYGFNIYRHGQLIEAHNKDWFKAHLMTSRIIGEVEMDFLDATFYKQGLQQSELWALATAHMTTYLKPMEKASRSLSRAGNIDKPAESKKIITEMRDAFDEDPFDFAEDEKNSTEDDGKKGKKDGGGSTGDSVNEKIKNVVKEQSLVLENEGEIKITYLETTLSSNVKAPYDYIFDADEDDNTEELQVILYTDHPLWSVSRKQVDDETKKIVATSDAIYRMLVTELDFSPAEALNIRNEWVWLRTKGDER